MKAPVYIRDHIESLVRLIRAESQTVGDQTNTEALHDLRVCVRRLRAALRTTRPLYGKKKTRAIEDRLRKVTNETNALRDAEVTLPVLRSISLDIENQPELDAWLSRLEAETDAKRTALFAWLAGDPLTEPLATVIALVGTQPVADAQLSVGKHARAHTDNELKRVRRMLKDAPQWVGDPARMHTLRIAAKRLRYTAEFYGPVLGRNASKWAKIANLIQQELGMLHDLDVLMEMTRIEKTLPEDTRKLLLARLGSRREAQAQRSIITLKDARRTLKK